MFQSSIGGLLLAKESNVDALEKKETNASDCKDKM